VVLQCLRTCFTPVDTISAAPSARNRSGPLTTSNLTPDCSGESHALIFFTGSFLLNYTEVRNRNEGCPFNPVETTIDRTPKPVLLLDIKIRSTSTMER